VKSRTATQTRTLTIQGAEGSSGCSGNTEEAKLSSPSEIVNQRWRKSRNSKDLEELIEARVAGIRKTDLLNMQYTTDPRKATILILVARLPAAQGTQTKMAIPVPMGKIIQARPQKAVTASSSTMTQRLTMVKMRIFRTTSPTVTPIMDRTVAMEVEISNEDQVQPLEICGVTLMATDRVVGPI
jgi:hypothetical protein